MVLEVFPIDISGYRAYSPKASTIQTILPYFRKSFFTIAHAYRAEPSVTIAILLNIGLDVEMGFIDS